MELSECIRLALERIKVNKLRSMLTMLGIVIGVSSVITITTMGESLSKTLSSTMSSIGNTQTIECYVQPEYPENDVDWDTWVYPEMEQDDYVSIDELNGLPDALPGEVDYALAYSNIGQGTVTGPTYTANVSMIGTLPGYLDLNRLDLLKGRDITKRDVEEGRPVAVVSDHFVKYACDEIDPIDGSISITKQDGGIVKVYVVGVYKFNAMQMSMLGGHTAEKDIATPILLPFTFAASLSDNPYNSSDRIENFEVVATQDSNPTDVGEHVKNYFNENKYIDSQFHIEMYDMASQLSMITNALSIVTIVISIIAAISLIVGGVGVMNIMLVSVIERTREIGVQKALGAKNSAISVQFLTEATVICLIGGLIGVLIGLLNGFIFSKVGGTMLSSYNSGQGGIDLVISVTPNISAILISLIFSMLIGIVFGYYPAKRAAKLSPIEALRYE